MLENVEQKKTSKKDTKTLQKALKTHPRSKSVFKRKLRGPVPP